MTKQEETNECSAPEKNTATVDQIAWMHKAIDSALRMASAMEKEVDTGAQLEIFRTTREGLSKGVVREVLRILHYDVWGI